MSDYKQISAYVNILGLLGRKDYVKAHEIQQRLSHLYGDKAPSLKTVYRLIEKMFIAFGIEINYDEKKKGYKLEGKTQPIQFQILNQLASFGFFEEVWSKHQQSAEKFIDVERVPVTGEKHLLDIFNAIREQKWIDILYETFNGNKKKEHTIAPLLLKQYDNRWYVLAVKEGNPEKTGIKNRDAAILFGLERIKEIKITERPINKDIFKNLPAYQAMKKEGIKKPADIFNNIIGVRFTDETHTLKTEKIELQFTKTLAPYIESKPLHPSQEIISIDETGLRMELSLKINQELKSLILSYGSGVSVLKPESLRKEIKTALKEALNQY